MSGSVEFFSSRHRRSTAGINSIINGSVSLSVLVTDTTILREKNPNNKRISCKQGFGNRGNEEFTFNRK